MPEFLFNIRTYIVIYLIFINLMGFIMMGNDKTRARKGKWRISEKSFFIVSIVCGSVGTLIGMYAFRHKTKHAAFVFGIPLILILQIIIVLLLQHFLHIDHVILT